MDSFAVDINKQHSGTYKTHEFSRVITYSNVLRGTIEDTIQYYCYKSSFALHSKVR